VVTLRPPDGSPLDLTCGCRIAIEPPVLAHVSSQGVVHPARSGTGVIRAMTDGVEARALIRVTDVGRSRPASFRADVATLLTKTGCNMGACHGNLSGKGGFRLSLRGEDPSFDHAALTRDQFGRRIDRVVPERSLIFLKPTGTIAHEGGQRFRRDSIEAA